MMHTQILPSHSHARVNYAQLRASGAANELLDLQIAASNQDPHSRELAPLDSETINDPLAPPHIIADSYKKRLATHKTQYDTFITEHYPPNNAHDRLVQTSLHEVVGKVIVLRHLLQFPHLNTRGFMGDLFEKVRLLGTNKETPYDLMYNSRVDITPESRSQKFRDYATGAARDEALITANSLINNFNNNRNGAGSSNAVPVLPRPQEPPAVAHRPPRMMRIEDLNTRAVPYHDEPVRLTRDDAGNIWVHPLNAGAPEVPRQRFAPSAGLPPQTPSGLERPPRPIRIGRERVLITRDEGGNVHARPIAQVPRAEDGRERPYLPAPATARPNRDHAVCFTFGGREEPEVAQDVAQNVARPGRFTNFMNRIRRPSVQAPIEIPSIPPGSVGRPDGSSDVTFHRTHAEVTARGILTQTAGPRALTTVDGVTVRNGVPTPLNVGSRVTFGTGASRYIWDGHRLVPVRQESI